MLVKHVGGQMGVDDPRGSLGALSTWNYGPKMLLDRVAAPPGGVGGLPLS